ncbi:MAG TPA: CHRD domain-containing protein, partial [Actinomycetota bacterium]|nr:CHRD domain-containing protein [Actinomycetota bacterium]
GITLPSIGAHIHLAPVTDPGPIVVPLTAPDSTGMSSGCTTVDRALAKAIAKDPSAYYVNVHTTDFPAGALRAQLG